MPRDFNPHHRKGGDAGIHQSIQADRNFNPHHRKGGDKNADAGYYRIFNFNPHHRKGGDSAGAAEEMAAIIFQSTPPQRW